MPNYRYERALDGSPEGHVRTLQPDEAAPLLKSGAVVETDEPASENAPAPPPAGPITSESVGGTKASVQAPKPAASRRSN